MSSKDPEQQKRNWGLVVVTKAASSESRHAGSSRDREVNQAKTFDGGSMYINLGRLNYEKAKVDMILYDWRNDQ